MRGDHQARIQYAAKRIPRSFHGVHCRDQDAFLNPLKHVLVHQRRRAVRPHTARIRPLIAVKGWLVILGGTERENSLTVRDRDDAGPA